MDVDDTDNNDQRTSSVPSNQPSSSSSLSGLSTNTETCTQSSNAGSLNEVPNNNDKSANSNPGEAMNNVRPAPPPLPDIELDEDTAEPVAAEVVIGSQPWHNALPAVRGMDS